MRAVYRRKTERQAFEIRAGAVKRFTTLFDRAKQFGHSPVETLFKPCSHELRPRHTFCRAKHDLLRRLVYTVGTDRPLATDQIGTVLLALTSVAIEKYRRLRAGTFDNRLRQQRRLGLLPGRTSS